MILGKIIQEKILYIVLLLDGEFNAINWGKSLPMSIVLIVSLPETILKRIREHTILQNYGMYLKHYLEVGGLFQSQIIFYLQKWQITGANL